MLAASPAPDWTMTLKPSFASFGTTSGTVATRFSPGKISLGTPITCATCGLLLWACSLRDALLAAATQAAMILRPSPVGYSCGGVIQNIPEEKFIMKRFGAALVAVIAAVGLTTAGAQDKKTMRISIGTGGTGGVYYPLGGGLAAMLSKYVPGAEATAAATAGSLATLT